MKYATCVGSRNISSDEELIAIEVGKKLAEKGYTIRSGNAGGADIAFQQGAIHYGKDMTEVFLPWNGFNKPYIGNAYTPSDEYLAYAVGQLEQSVMPWVRNTKQAVQKLHGRNYYQVYGMDNQVSDVCFYISDEDNGNVQGGTRTAVELCRINNVPCYNLLYMTLNDIMNVIEGL